MRPVLQVQAGRSGEPSPAAHGHAAHYWHRPLLFGSGLQLEVPGLRTGPGAAAAGSRSAVGRCRSGGAAHFTDTLQPHAHTGLRALQQQPPCRVSCLCAQTASGCSVRWSMTDKWVDVFPHKVEWTPRQDHQGRCATAPCHLHSSLVGRPLTPLTDPADRLDWQADSEKRLRYTNKPRAEIAKLIAANPDAAWTAACGKVKIARVRASSCALLCAPRSVWSRRVVVCSSWRMPL